MKKKLVKNDFVGVGDLLVPICCSCGTQQGEMRPVNLFVFEGFYYCPSCAIVFYLTRHGEYMDGQLKILTSSIERDLETINELKKELDARDKEISFLKRKLEEKQ